MKILLLLLLSFNAYAHFDLSAGAALRSYPALGGEVNAQFGYNFLLWGSGPGADKKNIMYGLLRPALNVNSSAVINGYDARLELYPISIIGLAIGQRNIVSDFEDFPFFDCEKVRCKGTIKRDYTQFKMALGFGPLMAVGNIVMSKNSYSDENDEGKPVAEFRFAALANPIEDTMYRSQYVLGYKHSNKGILGVVAEYVNFAQAEQTYNMDLLVYTTKPETTTYVFGVGQFSSTYQTKGLIGVFQMKTDFLPPSKLF